MIIIDVRITIFKELLKIKRIPSIDNINVFRLHYLNDKEHKEKVSILYAGQTQWRAKLDLKGRNTDNNNNEVKKEPKFRNFVDFFLLFLSKAIQQILLF